MVTTALSYDLQKLERTVRAGLKSLRVSLTQDYPGGYTAWMNERNLSQHVGYQLSRSGFATFCEAALHRHVTKEKVQRRLDLLAVCRERHDTVVAIECKRLTQQKGDWALGMANDVGRINQYLDRYAYSGYERRRPGLRLGGVLALAFQQSIVDWWMGEGPAPTTNAGWAAAASHLRKVAPRRNVIPLWDDVVQARRLRVAPWAIYAVWER